MTARNRRRCFRMSKIKDTVDFIHSSDLDEFEQFCRRMWLDYCDEHGSVFGGISLSYEEYTREYSDYLMERYGTGKK
tara:strand:- start:146 stop:376 length:231 start_codon:yes stop_codon:yes gene_type:complete